MSERNQPHEPARQKNMVACVESLRGRLAQCELPSDAEGLLGDLSRCAAQVMSEHGGMAEELLGVYEQLGAVFEVTRRLPEMRGESEIIKLFLGSLERTFYRCEIVVARCREPGRWAIQGSDLRVGDWLGTLIEKVRQRRQSIVETPPAGEMPDSIPEVMVGGLHSGDSFVCAFVLLRHRDAPEFRSSEMLLIDSLLKFCGDLVTNHRLVRELGELSMAMVRSLVSAVDQKDEYTSGHSLRVSFYATMLGRELGMPDDELQMLEWSALLHDVGKIGIRDDVLKKSGKLTEEEFNHIKEHPVRSYQVVKGVPQLARALDGALYHHEHYDGNGYPEGLKGEDIPLQARIIQVGDIFDALTSSRSYRAAYCWQKALSILQEEAGSTVDPALQPVFDRLIRERLSDDPASWEALVRRAERQVWNVKHTPTVGGV